MRGCLYRPARRCAPSLCLCFRVSFSVCVPVDSLTPWFAEHLTPLEESILNLARDLESVQIEQRYMRQRERAHRNSARALSPSLCARVCVCVCVCVCMSVCVFVSLSFLFAGSVASCVCARLV
jgi:hypothetical protein